MSLPSKRGRGKNHGLTIAQRECAEIFATNDIHRMTVEEVAEHIGVTKRTIYRWKQDPAFIAYQNEIAETVMEDMLAEAYITLKDMVRNGKSEKTKLEAVKLILQNRGKLKDVTQTTVEVVQSETIDERKDRISQLEMELMESLAIDIDKE